MDEKTIIRYMEEAQKKISKHLGKNLYMDDLMWGDDVFKISIFKDCGIVNGVPKEKLVTDLIFKYDECDTFERSGRQQFVDWLKDILEELRG